MTYGCMRWIMLELGVYGVYFVEAWGMESLIGMDGFLQGVLESGVI